MASPTRRRRPPGLGPAQALWQESVGCGDGWPQPSAPSHQTLPGPAAQQRPGRSSAVRVLLLQELRLAPGEECASLPDYAEEALSGKQERCRGPSASPFQQLPKYNALFTLSVPRPRPPPQSHFPRRELTTLITQKIL